MKNKTKLVVALASLLAVTGGVGAYSTFAWFTVNRAATITINNVSATSKSGDLKMKVAAVANGGTDITDDANEVVSHTFNNNVALTDVSSGAGLNFFKPTYNQATGAVAGYDTETANPADATALRWFLEFKVTFFNHGTDAIDVYLNEGSLFSPTTNHAENAFRMSVLNSDKSAAVMVWQPGAEVDVNATNPTTSHDNVMTSGTDKYAYISAATGASATYAGASNVVADHTIMGTALSSITSSANVQAKQFVCNIAAGGTEATPKSTELYFRIWMEGTSTWCYNDIKGQTSNVTLKFVGI
jgi:hypothetical protein